MDNAQPVPKQLLDSLISLKLDLAAHVSALRNSRISDPSGNLLNWEKIVAYHRDQLDSNRAESLYSDIGQEFLHTATSECVPALRLLLGLVERKTPLEK